ncbi:MAG: S66 peptidase family protein, partial [Nocardioidaceae bacterium]
MAERLRACPALRPGDTVAVLAASGPAEQDRLDGGLAALEGLGLKPDVLASARASTDPLDGGYLAGDDAQRAADLTTALSEAAYRGVFCARGGYGAQRTLELVDWSAVDRDLPRVLVGYSDVTALIEAIASRLGWVTLFGPMVTGADFHAGSYAFDILARMLFEPAAARELTFPGARTLVPGVAEGVTTGGTLSLLASSIGTPTSVPADGAILMIEEVDEEPYRLDRLLTQLRRSGYLDGVSGVLAGSFSECGDPGLVERLLLDRLGDLGVPILAGADIGHGVPQQT